MLHGVVVKPNGYLGKLLIVDLSERSLSTETLPEAMLRDLIGGYGIGARLVLERMKPGTDPLGPSSTLGFLTGPLTGTPAPFGNRYTVVGRSPLTLTWGDANSGGDFGPYLKFSGFDGILLSGVAECPTYLLVDHGEATLQDASYLWGKDTYDTEAALVARHGDDSRISCVGPAGERLSLISGIMNDHGRTAGRSGLGAVMGSKRLKAVVVRGNRAVPVADRTRVTGLAKTYIAALNGPVAETFREYGTCGFTAGAVRIGDAPVKNWGGTALDFPNSDAISDSSVIAWQAKKYGCWHCPLRCGGVMKAGAGAYQWDAGVHKPEYETLASFGSMCLNNNLSSIIKFNDICNRLGLDTISAGTTIAFAIECYENGVVSGEEAHGLELTWGNHRAMVELAEKIGRREGFGDVLADGVQRASQRIGRGSEEYAVHIHGQEVPMHDPKCRPDYGTTYQTDATPARHTQGHESFVPAELGLAEFDRKTYGGRGSAHRAAAMMAHGLNAAGICLFGYACMPGKALPELLSAVTGWEYDLDAVQTAGERIACLRQLINVRERLNSGHFPVPGRIIGRPPHQKGPLKDTTVDLETMSRDFYHSMGWDPGTGMPSEKRLRELGLLETLKWILGK